MRKTNLKRLRKSFDILKVILRFYAQSILLHISERKGENQQDNLLVFRKIKLKNSFNPKMC
jgi:hypothetical protein